jgi:hypothetical protein
MYKNTAKAQTTVVNTAVDIDDLRILKFNSFWDKDGFSISFKMKNFCRKIQWEKNSSEKEQFVKHK